MDEEPGHVKNDSKPLLHEVSDEEPKPVGMEPGKLLPTRESDVNPTF